MQSATGTLHGLVKRGLGSGVTMQMVRLSSSFALFLLSFLQVF